MVVSSVSPERWLMTAPQPWARAMSIVCSVSLSVPIWLSLMRMALAESSSMPRASRSGLVTKKSSPTSWHLSPTFSVSFFQPCPVVLAEAVLEADDGVLVDPVGPELDHLAGLQRAAFLGQLVGVLTLGIGLTVDELGDGRVERDGDLLAGLVAGSLDRREDGLDGRRRWTAGSARSRPRRPGRWPGPCRAARP